MQKPLLVCLMGPTASGKTALAIELTKRFTMDIISVDSAMIYKGMDIGTAKPSKEQLSEAPHRLIDIVDPSESYSAGQFRVDALKEIESSVTTKRIPLLVGGTMMYFRALQQGLASLPRANSQIRLELEERAAQIGWESLHTELSRIDPHAAARIQPRDSQRIQRALEVYQLTGKTLSELQQHSTTPLDKYHVLNLAITSDSRSELHERIAKRLALMFDAGFVEEVRSLYARGDLHAALPSMRSVGYAQVWEYLSGVLSEQEMRDRALFATRQLAKRQLTWLRSWPSLTWVRSLNEALAVIARSSHVAGCGNPEQS